MKALFMLVGGATATMLSPLAAEAVPFLPNFAAATFLPGAAVDHPYFPLLPGTFREYRNDDEGEAFILTVTGARKTIAGVDAVVVSDRAFEDDLLVEETFDYYAQDTVGNVWYLGEDVVNFIYDADGNLIATNTSSSWLTGVNGALPGFIMPAEASMGLGFNYFQEFAALDAALDQGTIDAFLAQVDLDIGSFFDVARIFESSELDAASLGFKYYARGFGLILEEELERLDGALEVALSVPLVSAGVVPEPVLTGPLMTGFGVMLILGARRRTWAQALARDPSLRRA